MGQCPPPHSCSSLWGGALFPFSSAKTTKLYLVQDFVGAGPSILGEGAHRLAWEGAIPPEVGAAGWDGDTWGRGSRCVWASLGRSPPRIRVQPVVSAYGGGEGRQLGAQPQACPQEPQELEEEEGGGLRERSWFRAPLLYACAFLQFLTRALTRLCPPQALGLSRAESMGGLLSLQPSEA